MIVGIVITGRIRTKYFDNLRPMLGPVVVLEKWRILKALTCKAPSCLLLSSLRCCLLLHAACEHYILLFDPRKYQKLSAEESASLNVVSYFFKPLRSCFALQHQQTQRNIHFSIEMLVLPMKPLWCLKPLDTVSHPDWKLDNSVLYFLGFSPVPRCSAGLFSLNIKLL